jgi:hypothetical protein
MRPGWKKFAKRADKAAYEPDQAKEALPDALGDHWRAERCGELVDEIRAALNDGRQAQLFDQNNEDRLGTLKNVTGAGLPAAPHAARQYRAGCRKRAPDQRSNIGGDEKHPSGSIPSRAPGGLRNTTSGKAPTSGLPKSAAAWKAAMRKLLLMDLPAPCSKSMAALLRRRLPNVTDSTKECGYEERRKTRSPAPLQGPCH